MKTNPAPQELNAAFPPGRWYAEYRRDASGDPEGRLAVFYPGNMSPAEAGDMIRAFGVFGPYSSLSGPCLEFPA